MRFAWEGFSLEAPDDWAPVTLTGDRDAGYVRLASSAALAGQVRWHTSKEAPDLAARLESYRAKLRDGAKRRRIDLEFGSEAQRDSLLYRYRAGDSGRGALFYSPGSRRVFILEVTASSRKSTLAAFKSMRASFQDDASSDLEEWSVLGLNLRLPPGLRVGRKEFRSGHTRIAWSGRGYEIVGERWGLARQLVTRHGLEAWARAALDLARADAETTPDGLRLRSPRTLLRAKTQALVRWEPDENQILSVRSTSNRKEYEPQWAWLTPPNR